MPTTLTSSSELLLCGAPAVGQATRIVRPLWARLLVNANQAGVPHSGLHAKISRNGRHVGLVFAPFGFAAAISVTP